MVGPLWSPSAVWLNTTSRMTSMPARCSALTMSRNSSRGPKGVLAGTVRVVGGEERHRTVAPVVDEAWRTVLSVKLEDWEQLYSGDTEILQIGNLGDDAGIGAPRGQGQAGTRVPREPADVHFVNHRVCKGALQRSVPFPVVLTGVCHNALH